jgi:hypothetical protein
MIVDNMSKTCMVPPLKHRKGFLMLRFLTHYRSLAMLFASVILTSIITSQTFLSHIVFFVNLAILLVARMIIQFRENDYKTPSILILVSVGMTAISTSPTRGDLIAEAANFAILLGMWWMTEWEKKNHISA